MGRQRAPSEQDACPSTEPQTSPPAPAIELVDTGDIPGGGHLLLMRCGDDFSIQFERDELMGSYNYRSERALATMACERLGRNDGDVLVGGLGMGFTLGAALGAWASSSRIVVAELVPQVVEWARGPLAHISGIHLNDQRVSLKITDVHDVIASASNAFDAILLDVDNGPDGFIQLENDRLYCNWGLRAAYSALRPAPGWYAGHMVCLFRSPFCRPAGSSWVFGRGRTHSRVSRK